VPEIRENASSFKERETKHTVFVRERASEHVDMDDDVPLLRRVDEEDERYDRRNIPRALTPFPSMVSLHQEGGAGEELHLNKEKEMRDSFLVQDKAYGQSRLFDGALMGGLNSKDTTIGLFSSSGDVTINQERIFQESVDSKEKEVSEENQSVGFAGTSKPTCTVSAHLWRERKAGLILILAMLLRTTCLIPPLAHHGRELTVRMAHPILTLMGQGVLLLMLP
jgi:hypothetical protein